MFTVRVKYAPTFGKTVRARTLTLAPTLPLALAPALALALALTLPLALPLAHPLALPLTRGGHGHGAGVRVVLPAAAAVRQLRP